MLQYAKELICEAPTSPAMVVLRLNDADTTLPDCILYVTQYLYGSRHFTKLCLSVQRVPEIPPIKEMNAIRGASITVDLACDKWISHH